MSSRQGVWVQRRYGGTKKHIMLLRAKVTAQSDPCLGLGGRRSSVTTVGIGLSLVSDRPGRDCDPLTPGLDQPANYHSESLDVCVARDWLLVLL